MDGWMGVGRMTSYPAVGGAVRVNNRSLSPIY
jgi:hypothetical protein